MATLDNSEKSVGIRMLIIAKVFQHENNVFYLVY
jgi:hypothetical protein